MIKFAFKLLQDIYIWQVLLIRAFVSIKKKHKKGFQFSYTISNKCTPILIMLVYVSTDIVF